MRLEDFVLDQDKTLQKLREFLGFPLVKIPVKPEVVGRYKADAGDHCIDRLRPYLADYGYDLPRETARAGKGIRHVRPRGKAIRN